MAHVCPWWFVRSFDNPVRSLFHRPEQMLGEWVQSGMRVLDVGCGAGFNSLGLARLVGTEGRVVAVDLQPRMLTMTRECLRRAGMLAHAELIESTVDDLGISGQPAFDFALAFWMAHEVSEPAAFFDQLRRALKPGAPLLVVEPKLHVTSRSFEATVKAARGAGFQVKERPKIALSRAALLV